MVSSDLRPGELAAIAERDPRQPVCWECGDDIPDGVPANLTEVWRHGQCAARRRLYEAMPPLDDERETDPRKPAYLADCQRWLHGTSRLIEQWQRKEDTVTAELRGGRQSLEDLLTEKRAEIASQLTEDNKPLYGNEDKRRAALLGWQRESGLAEELENSIREREDRLNTLHRDLELMARERGDLLTEMRFAAAWLTYAAGASKEESQS